MSKSSSAIGVKQFADEPSNRARLAALRWPNGPQCPSCGSIDVGTVAGRELFQCRSCRRQFSVRVGTIFEDSPLSVGAWFSALWCVSTGDRISSRGLGESLSITQKSAWLLLHRIRMALSCVGEPSGGAAFDDLLGKLAQVPKEEAEQRAKLWKKKRTAKKKKKPKQ